MNLKVNSKTKWSALVTGLILCGASIADGAQSPVTAAPNAGKAATNSVARSKFVIPRSPVEGKDPFFPRSMGPYPKASDPIPQPVTTNPTPVVVIEVDLRLGGISGTETKRLAIINGRTFEVGEEADVNTQSGRVRVRCIDIRPDGVSVLVNGQRKELRLRAGA